jgi:hypothetical protein
MDSIWRRLKYYGIGFSIGLFFVFFFFQNRGCSWLPENRVKNSILDRVLVLPAQEEALIKKFNFTEEELTHVLNDGKVLFGESKKQGNPKVYAVEKEIEGKGTHTFFFTLPEESFVSEIFFSVENARQVKQSTQGKGRLIHFPKDDELIFVDSNYTAKCQQSRLKLDESKDILKLLHKNGRIDFSKSNLKASPKPEHYVEFTMKNKNLVGTKMIWYKNKLNITRFIVADSIDCDL